jgi:hypothetical protein
MGPTFLLKGQVIMIGLLSCVAVVKGYNKRYGAVLIQLK